VFFESADNKHGLAHNPFKALVAPRPIGWISSLDTEGRPNLAPYSFFNAVGNIPPVVMFSSSGRKDSIANIEATGEFVCNLATYDLRDAMNATSAPLPRGASEFEAAGLEAAPCRLVKVPRVAASPAALECRFLQSLTIRDIDGNETDNHMVLGQVVGIHIDDAYIVDGKVDTPRLKLLSRLGYMDYAVVDNVFSLDRPAGG